VKSLYFYREGSVRIPLTPVRLFVSGEGFSAVRIGGPVFAFGRRYGMVILELVFLNLTVGWDTER